MDKGLKTALKLIGICAVVFVLGILFYRYVLHKVVDDRVTEALNSLTVCQESNRRFVSLADPYRVEADCKDLMRDAEHRNEASAYQQIAEEEKNDTIRTVPTEG